MNGVFEHFPYDVDNDDDENWDKDDDEDDDVDLQLVLFHPGPDHHQLLHKAQYVRPVDDNDECGM